MFEKNADWLARAHETVQRLQDDLAAADMTEIAGLLHRASSSIDPPPDRVHAAALSMMLIAICDQIVQMLHEPEGIGQCSCHRAAWLHARALMKWEDPRLAIGDWAQGFLAHVEREHPRTGAVLAAALIRSDSTKVWMLGTLARAVGTRPMQLRQEFHARFGLRPTMYIHLVRAARAVALFQTPTKVEAIAWEVGYRSKKDLYRALKLWVGATPTELRALSDEERTWLERQLRMQYLRGSRVSGNSKRRDDKHARRRIAVGIGVAVRTAVRDR